MPEHEARLGNVLPGPPRGECRRTVSGVPVDAVDFVVAMGWGIDRIFDAASSWVSPLSNPARVVGVP
jgi:hypothetical protein